jgi:hypothetical protein
VPSDFKLPPISKKIKSKNLKFFSSLVAALNESCLFAACPVDLALTGTVWSRVARWYIFKPKIPIWENFGGT